MGESFVDAVYRGVELGRRLKLRDVLPDAAYLEIPLPMPVGTRIELACDEGLRIAVQVTSVHEQVGGSDHVPGMGIRPTLDGQAAAWWRGRIDVAAVARVESEAQARAEAEAGLAARGQVETAAEVRPAEAEAVPVAVVTPERSQGSKRNGRAKGRARSEPGAAEAGPADATVAEPRPSSGPRTVVMSTEAVEAALAAAGTDGGQLVDDGKRTTVMDAIDISMITGEPPPEVGAAGDLDDDSGEITIEEGDDEESPASTSGKTAVATGKAKAKGPKRRRKR